MIERLNNQNVLAPIQVSAISMGTDPEGQQTMFKTDGNRFSTNTLLGSTESFQTNILSLIGYTQVQTLINADQDGSFVAEFYDDEAGTNLVRTFTVPYFAVNGVAFLAAPAFSQYIRYTYNNGSTAQGMFHFSIKFVTKAISGQLLSLDSPINPLMVSALTRSVIVGKDKDGTFSNVRVNKGGALSTTNFLTEVEQGNVAGYTKVNKFGNNPAITTLTVSEDVWQGGGEYTGQPTGAAELVEVVSTDVLDTILGTGARTILIKGLDAAGLEQEETIELSGIVPAQSVNTYSRVFTASVLSAGTLGANQGVLLVRHATTTANVFISIAAKVNRSTVAAYTIPSNKRGILLHYNVSISRTNGSPSSAIVSLRARKSGGVYNAIRYEQTTTNSPLEPNLGGGIELEAGTDIKVTVETVSDNTTSVSVSFVILLTDI